MSVLSDNNKLLATGLRIIAFALFPLLWFLFQAILFREISKAIPRSLLIFLAIAVGSTFIFLLYNQDFTTFATLIFEYGLQSENNRRGINL